MEECQRCARPKLYQTASLYSWRFVVTYTESLSLDSTAQVKGFEAFGQG